MNRAQRRALKGLPMSLNAWEVALVQVPLTIEGVQTEGLLVVAEHGSGVVRAAGPVLKGESLWPTLGSAFSDPPSQCSPARPARLFCSDPVLIKRLGRELRGLGIRIEQVESVPAVDDLLESMMAHLAPISAPGITVDFELWASALETLCKVAPWQAVSDGVVFRFNGVAVLADVVAVVLGRAGEQLGVAFYPTAGDHRRFLAAAVRGDMSALDEVEALNLYLDPISELEPHEVAACREAALVTSDGLCPRVLLLAGGIPSRANELEQHLLLAVVQGITTLASSGAGVLELAPSSCVASTCLGAIEVRSTPSGFEHEEFEPDLVDVEHAVGVGPLLDLDDGEERMALVIKLRKRDAVRLAGRLAEVDGLQFYASGEGHDVHALAGSVDLGSLVHVEYMGDIQRLITADRVVLCVSAGGPKRPQIRPRDFVMMRDVDVVGAKPRDGHDPVFDGPAGRWPKGSETLLRFAEPMMLAAPSLSETQLRQALEMACMVWNAVVFADFAGDSKFLDDLQNAAGKEPGPQVVVNMLIDRKRAQFMGDPRVFGSVQVEPNGDRSQVHVESRLPPGYTVGGVSGE